VLIIFVYHKHQPPSTTTTINHHQPQTTPLRLLIILYALIIPLRLLTLILVTLVVVPSLTVLLQQHQKLLILATLVVVPSRTLLNLAVLQGLTSTISDVYPQLLQSISPLFSLDPAKSNATTACVDNAAAAVHRIIMCNILSAPLPKVLPVVLRSLPLKNDYTENETVCKCLLGLMSSNNADLAANIPELKRVFTEACADDSGVDDE